MNWLTKWVKDFGLQAPVPHNVLLALAEWQEPIDLNDLASFSERNKHEVEMVLRWAELLGISKMEGNNCWSVDPMIAKVLVRFKA